MELAFDPARRLIGHESCDSEWGNTRPAAAKRVPGCSAQSFEVCDCMLDIVSALFNVSGRELRKPGRTRLPVARVRQIAMYVCHCVLGLTMTDIGRGFGRDRTTVMHACHLIEDMRDEEDFDRMIVTVERVTTAAFRLSK